MRLLQHAPLTVPIGGGGRSKKPLAGTVGSKSVVSQVIMGLFHSKRESLGGMGVVARGRATSLDSTRQHEGPPQKEHVIFMVHGLFGSARNWRVICDLLAEQLDPQGTLLYVSCVNEYTKTYDGIDLCGERLADEVREVVGRHPGLQRISFVGHSMGGLIARYCCGRLFDPQTQTICGLQPCHFISLATPHLGCDGETTPAQVPLLSWAGAVPAVGGGVQRILKGVAVPFSSLAFKRSGQQFFLIDREGGGWAEPLLLRMTRDHPVEGYFYSALASFETRTAYANSSGDHLVGWANSSLRSLQQLPKLHRKGLGVVREDPLEVAWHPAVRARLGATRSAAQLHSGEGHTVTAGDIMRSTSPEQLASVGECAAMEGEQPAAEGQQQQQQQPSLTWERRQQKNAAGGSPTGDGITTGSKGADSCGQGEGGQENGGVANGDVHEPPLVLPLLVPSKPGAESLQSQGREPMPPPPQAQQKLQEDVGNGHEQRDPGSNGSSGHVQLQQQQHHHHGSLGERMRRAVSCAGGEGDGGTEEGMKQVTGRPGKGSPASQQQPQQQQQAEQAERASGAGSHESNAAVGGGSSGSGLLGRATMAVGAAVVSEEPLSTAKAAVAASPGAGGPDPDKLRPGTPCARWHGPPGSNSMDQVLASDRGEYVGEMLARLQSLNWRRVDVCFGRSILPFLAHQHLQVQRWWLNWEGIATARHLAMQLRAMEGLREDMHRDCQH